MLNKREFLVAVYLFFGVNFISADNNLDDQNDQSVHLQAFAPLVEPQAVFDLTRVEQQLENTKYEPILIDVEQDEASGKTFQRKGILVRRNNAQGTVLMCHGYLGCKRDAIALKHLFPTYNVLAFDFRAHGELTEGQKSTIGKDEALDVIGAVKFIKSDELMGQKPVIAYAYSMGAVASMEAESQQHLFDAMILDCPFDSSDDSMSRGIDEKMKNSVLAQALILPCKQFYLDHMYDESGLAPIITHYLFKQITTLNSKAVETKFKRVAPVESIKKVTVPCLFIHCVNDKKVPVHAVESIYKNKPGFKELWITLGKGHYGSYNNDPEWYWYRVNKFLNRVLAGNHVCRNQERVYDDRLGKHKDAGQQ